MPGISCLKNAQLWNNELVSETTFFETISTTMPFFSIGYPEKERLQISLIGKPADSATEGYDWIKAQVRIVVGGFTGDVQIQMCVSDMIRFKEELEPVYRNLTGKAEFKTIEDQLYIQIEAGRLGHVQAEGYLADDLGMGNKLNFAIEYDQTLLWHTISEIDEALFELSHEN